MEALSPNIEDIVLYRGETGLGFLIAGGTDSPVSDIDTGIFVAKVIKGAAADRDGRLVKGDHIIQVNGSSMSGLTHKQAVVRLTTAAGDKVVLKVDHGRGKTFLRQLSSRKNATNDQQQRAKRNSPSGLNPTRRDAISIELIQGQINLCAPCAYEGRETGAVCYCVQCREYFCGSCQTHHQKFSFLRNHTLEHREIVKPGGVMSIVERYQTLIS